MNTIGKYFVMSRKEYTLSGLSLLFGFIGLMFVSAICFHYFLPDTSTPPTTPNSSYDWTISVTYKNGDIDTLSFQSSREPYIRTISSSGFLSGGDIESELVLNHFDVLAVGVRSWYTIEKRKV